MPQRIYGPVSYVRGGVLLLSGSKASSWNYTGDPIAPSSQLSVAVIGDAEPKPHPAFENMSRAVDAINDLEEPMGLRSVLGVGDIAHRGTDEQYEKATGVLSRLRLPFYTTMGNEEWPDVERFRRYAHRWSQGDEDVGARFIKEWGEFVFIFLSGELTRSSLSDDDINWLVGSLGTYIRKKAVLVVHAPAPDRFSNGSDRSIGNPLFSEVYRYSNLKAILSGHLHFDLDVDPGVVKDESGVVHIHSPGIERTKVGDKHRPRFRVLRFLDSGLLQISTYDLVENGFDPAHSWRITLR